MYNHKIGDIVINLYRSIFRYCFTFKDCWLLTFYQGGPVLSRSEYRDFWIRWSPYELSVGRGLTVDSGLIESETHPAAVVLNYNLRVYVHKAGNFAWITVHYGVCYQTYWKIQGALGMCAPLLVKGFSFPCTFWQ